MTEPSASDHLADVIDVGGTSLRPGDRVGPYIYERMVAVGGMAHVLLARDPGGQPVALKVLKASRIGTGLPRFRREFHALTRVHHENVIRVEAYGDILGHPYIAMEYVEGRDLHQEIRDFRDLSLEERWRRVHDILADLCCALAYIHRRGLVHRDLKPSNVLIDPQGHCKLTDFGIVKDLDPSSDPFVSTTLVGTWAYASPEQIMGEPIDHRSDLYSLGVMLYAMLTGRRPFVARDMAGYLEAHRDQRPAPPHEFVPAVPALLEDICLRLLKKAPRDRFQSAQEVLDLLQPEQAPVEVPVPPGPQDPTTWKPPLVGRRDPLDRIRDAVGALTRGQGGIVLVDGAEGSGRTRILGEALDYAARIGIPVHTARMAADEGAFETLLRLSADIGRELGARQPPDLGRAMRAFAVGRGQVTGDLRYQLYDGVREALVALLREGPLVLAVDDLHNAPAALVDLLVYLVRSIIVRDLGSLLVLVTARDDAPTPLLDVLRDKGSIGLEPVRVHLDALSLEDVLEIMRGMMGEGERAQALGRRLHAETEGNPFFVAEFLRSLLQRGTIQLGTSGEADPETDATEIAPRDFEIPAGVRQVVEGRLARLARHDRAVAEAVAVAGREVDIDVLLDLVTEDEEVVLDRIESMVSGGVLVERRVGLQTLIDFNQRKVGEVLYLGLEPERRGALHRRLAEALERQQSDSPVASEVIGEHYRRAGDAARAFRLWVGAARGLRDRNLLGEAWEVAEKAREIEEEARSTLGTDELSALRLELLRVRASALFNRGAWAQAAPVLEALEDAATQGGLAHLAAEPRLDLGASLRRLGRTEEGEAMVQDVLAGARARHDRVVIIDALHRLASFAWERGDLDECERLAGQGLVLATGPDLAASRAEILLALTAVQASRGQLAAATTGLSEAEGILRGLRNKRARAVVLSNLAEMLTWQGQLDAALRHATEALGLARDVVYREGEAFAYRVRAQALMEVGDLPRAHQDLEKSRVICQELGIAGDLAATWYLSGLLDLRVGKTRIAVARLRSGLRSAAEQDPECHTPALEAALARALCISGDSEGAEALLEKLGPQVDDLPLPRRTEVQLRMAAGWAALGHVEDALPMARVAARVAGARGFRIWALSARMLLVEIAPTAEAARFRQEAADLARELMADLPDDLAPFFRKQPGIERLLVPVQPG